MNDNEIKKRNELSVDEYVNGVIKNDKKTLARAITLVESNSFSHQKKAQEVLQKLMPYTGKSMRIGITGVPGAGKSTFIEELGCLLVDMGKRVAVLAIDPSSKLTKGSILGDKTRMDRLSREDSCFIRPSPTSGTLGGVSRKTFETMFVCEAAGYDVVLIETVGVGQSEIAVRSMVDFFLLIMIAGAGDELQGIKRGVIELADALLFNKADGDNKEKSLIARSEHEQVIHYLKPATQDWKTGVFTCSALTGEGVDEIWKVIEKFFIQIKNTGIFSKRRKQQTLEWFHVLIEDNLKIKFYSNPRVKEALGDIEKEVLDGDVTVASAVEKILSKANYI